MIDGLRGSMKAMLYAFVVTLIAATILIPLVVLFDWPVSKLERMVLVGFVIVYFEARLRQHKGR